MGKLALVIEPRNWRIFFFGAGVVARRRLPEMLSSGAVVSVFAEHFLPEIEALAQQYDTLSLRPMALQLDTARALLEAERPNLLILSTGDPAFNAAITPFCESLGLLVNEADSPKARVQFAARLERGDLLFAVNCQGLPALSTAIRKDLERQYPEEWLQLLPRFREQRYAILEGPGEPREKRAKLLALAEELLLHKAAALPAESALTKENEA